MTYGEVLGNVVSTVKHYKLEGRKLLLVQPLDPKGVASGDPLLAVDCVDAGPGDRVLVVLEGRSASMASGRDQSPLDAAIVAVVDHLELLETK